MGKYICPVCGYPDLEEPAWDINTGSPSFDICPCCGCEYGYEDAKPEGKMRHLQKWVKSGANWFESDLKPANWNLREQLLRVNVDLDDLLK
jgi:hypothetical protein